LFFGFVLQSRILSLGKQRCLSSDRPKADHPPLEYIPCLPVAFAGREIFLFAAGIIREGNGSSAEVIEV
jgi:hypothetical protein